MQTVPVTPPGNTYSACPHEWRWAGRGVPRDDCDRPARIVCVKCSEWFVKRCGVSSRAQCGPCGESHRRRVATVCASGSVGKEGLFMVTLTADGADVLPWDESQCSHDPEDPCSGRVGCVVESLAAADWNGRAPRAFSDVVTYVRRRSGVDVQYVACWETQKRGVLHRHALVRAPGISQRRFRAVWRLSAMRWGFGRQVQCDALSGDRAAWYVAKYASKSVDELEQLQVLDRRTGELVSGSRVRPWSASRRWGQTMAQVRIAQASWHQAQLNAQGSLRAPAAATLGGAAALDHNGELSTLPPIGSGDGAVLVGSVSSVS
jgi:hypothetical protein